MATKLIKMEKKEKIGWVDKIRLLFPVSCFDMRDKVEDCSFEIEHGFLNNEQYLTALNNLRLN